MNVNGTVETCWTAASKTIFSEGLGRLLLDVLVASETGEVEAGEVRNSLAGPEEFGLGACWAGDYWKRG